MKFCVDTSGWLDGWVRDYPHDVFPSVWKTIDEQIELGNIISAEEVYIELEKKMMRFILGSKGVKRC